MARHGAILTESQREFLRGTKEYSNQQTAIKARYRIRKRVRNALLDLTLLNEHLDAEDRKQIFGDIQSPDLQPDHGPEGVMIRENEIAGLINGVEFLYSAAQDAGVPFVRLLQLSIESAENRRIADYFEVTNVSVEFSVDHSYDYSRIANQIANGTPLAHEEYLALFELFREDSDRFTSLLVDLNIDIKERLHNETQLSVGESLVVVAHVGRDPERFGDVDVVSPLNDEVVHDFGLGSFARNTSKEQADDLTAEIAEEL